MKMNDETITARLDEIEKTRREKQIKFDAELRASQSKLDHLEEALQNADDPDEYKRVIREKNEAVDYINFLTQRQKKNRIPGSDMSHDEYKEMQDFLIDELSTLQSDYAPKVEKKISELVDFMEDYYKKATEIENIREHACRVFLGHGVTTFKVNELTEKVEDPLLFAKRILDAYFLNRLMVEGCERKIMSKTYATAPMYSSTDEAKICEELKRRQKE